MKRNISCIRQVLLTVETYQQVSPSGLQPLSVKELTQLLSATNYSPEDVFYTVKQLVDGFLLQGAPHISNHQQDYLILDLTPGGHEFLEHIRPPHLWKKVLHLTNEIEIHSLTVVCEIAKELALNTTHHLLSRYWEESSS